jgi:hypothetical protein
MRWLLLTLPLAACTTPEALPPEPTPFQPVAWSKSPPTLDTEVRGLREIRVIAHLHSHWSHDACDGEPQPGGVPDEACLQDLRDGLCTARIDVAMTSEHPGHAEETDLHTLLLLRGDDEEVRNAAGVPIANRMVCPSGHRVLLMPGIESGEMMPLGIADHVPGGYSQADAAGSAAVHDVDGLAWIAHTETRDLADLATRQLDGIELYQLHANIAPDLRRDYLGLDPFGFAADAGAFLFPEGHDLDVPPEPDLAPLGFLLPNEPSIVALETLGQTQAIGVTGGTDAHQNVFPVDAGDGERIDSYRRMLRWFNNRLRVTEVTPAGVREAMDAARSWIAFDVFGEPAGFDFFAEADGVAEAGSEVPVGSTIVVRAPTLDPRSPRADVSPDVRTVLIHSDGEQRTVVAEGDGELRAVAEQTGVYRVEVWITPHHLAPYLGDRPDFAEREVLWIQTGGLFVRQ